VFGTPKKESGARKKECKGANWCSAQQISPAERENCCSGEQKRSSGQQFAPLNEKKVSRSTKNLCLNRNLGVRGNFFEALHGKIEPLKDSFPEFENEY